MIQTMIEHFTAHTINCVCHSIRSMFRELGIYNFATHLIIFELHMSSADWASQPSGWIYKSKFSFLASPFSALSEVQTTSITKPYFTIHYELQNVNSNWFILALGNPEVYPHQCIPQFLLGVPYSKLYTYLQRM